jgi:hypothetical protein
LLLQGNAEARAAVEQARREREQGPSADDNGSLLLNVGAACGGGGGVRPRVISERDRAVRTQAAATATSELTPVVRPPTTFARHLAVIEQWQKKFLLGSMSLFFVVTIARLVGTARQTNILCCAVCVWCVCVRACVRVRVYDMCVCLLFVRVLTRLYFSLSPVFR